MKLFITTLLALLQADTSADGIAIVIDTRQSAPAAWEVAPVLTLGVPIPAEWGVEDVGELGFSGSSRFQFRELQRDRNGHVRWALCHFRAEDRLRPHAVTRTGPPQVEETFLAVESKHEIVVSTGPAQFTISKSKFNVVHSLRIDGRPVFQDNPGPGLVVVSRGQRFTSAEDTKVEVRLEENGPARATVVARGQLRSQAGIGHLHFTARLHFDQGGRSMRATVTLRNAGIAERGPMVFDAAWIELPNAGDGRKQVAFGTRHGEFSADLGGDTSAVLFQGDNDFMRSKRTGRILPFLTPSVGLQIDFGGRKIQDLEKPSDYAQGWSRVTTQDWRVQFGMRDFAVLFPSGLRSDADRIAIEFFSLRNPQKGLLFDWGTHESREVLFEWSNSELPPDFFSRLQYPAQARCEFEHYRRTGAIFGEKRLVTVEEERRFFWAQGHEWRLPPLSEPDLELERQFSFRTTGGGNQFDQDLARLLDYLRTGDAMRFYQARINVWWKADQAVRHSDDFDYSRYQNGVLEPDAEQPNTFHGKGAGSAFDDEHPHWPSLILYYYLTGDERFREAIEDYGEWRQFRSGNPDYGARFGGGIRHFRLWSRALRDVALLYEFTGKPTYLADLERMTDKLLGSIESGSGRGRNLERGYFYFGKKSSGNRRLHLFFLTEIHPGAVHEAIRVLPENDPRREALRDYLTGLAWFTLREAQVDPGARGYPYGYYLGPKPNKPGKRGDQTGYVLIHGYEQTGEPEFLRRSNKLAWRVLSYQHMLRGSELATHVRIYRALNANEIQWLNFEPEVRRHADGTFTLSWEEVPGALHYIVRHAERPLVPNLDFEPKSRTFAIDPAKASNLWAAQNHAGEPEPGQGNGRQVFRTGPIDLDEPHFTVQARLDPLAF